jgi:membrane protein DedA with SNARE-associated domain
VLDLIDKFGVVGVAVLIALETVIPPIPSEAILPLAGFRARTGGMHWLGAWVAATAGALAGALMLYGVGFWLGYDRLHALAGRRWFLLASQRDVERGRKLFDRHGSWVVAAARCVPVLRSVVSLPAGLAGMPLTKFCLLTLLGSGIWNALFIGAGWALAENWEQVDHVMAPVGIAMSALLIGALIVQAWRKLSPAESPTRRAG